MKRIYFALLVSFQALLAAPFIGAAAGPSLEDQDGPVLKLLTNKDKYQFVLGFASLDGDDDHLGYLALEHQGNWSGVSAQSNAVLPKLRITRLAFKGEDFNREQKSKWALHSGAKFDFYLANTQIGDTYQWQGVGIGIGYIFTPFSFFPGFNVTAGSNVEPEWFKIDSTTSDQYQLQNYFEAEYFVNENMGLTFRVDSINSGNGTELEQRLSDYWLGLRWLF